MDNFNVTGVGTSNSSDMDAVSWFIIVLLTCAPFVVFGCVSCTIFCVDCNEDGELVVLKLGFGARKRMIRKSIVTKTVQDHSDFNPEVCEISVRSRDQHAISNRSAVSTKPDYIDSDCNAQRCAICLETFEIGESVSWAKNTMYCNHTFHTSCIKHWLYRKRTCPVCRYGIILRQDQYVRCNVWSDWCCGRRRRVLYYKHHRNLMVQCRESGQYCIGHGLVFPYESPRLAIPYEPRIREMKGMLAIVRATQIFKSKDHAAKVERNSKHEKKNRRRGEIIIRKVDSSYDDEVLNKLSVEADTNPNHSTTVHIANDIECNDIQGQNDPVEESSVSSIQPTARNDDSISSSENHSTRLRSRSMLRRDDNGEDEPRIVALFEDEGANDELSVHNGRREFRRPRLRSGVMSEVMNRSTSVDNIREDDNTV